MHKKEGREGALESAWAAAKEAVTVTASVDEAGCARLMQNRLCTMASDPLCGE